MPSAITSRPSLRRRLAERRRIIGTTIQLGCCELVEIAGLAGYDFVMLDAEHGALDIGLLTQMIRAADAVGLAAMVRTPDTATTFIQRVLDAGAAGVVVPRVRDQAQAEQVVRAARFAPEGDRGACATTRAAGHLAADWPAFARRANAEVLVWLLVEDPEGVEDIGRIAAVAGLDGLVFGAFDLAQAIGAGGRVSHPGVVAAFEQVRVAAAAKEVELVAVTASEPGGAEGAMRRGARIVLDGFDAQMITACFRDRLEAARKEWNR